METAERWARAPQAHFQQLPPITKRPYIIFSEVGRTWLVAPRRAPEVLVEYKYVSNRLLAKIETDESVRTTAKVLGVILFMFQLTSILSDTRVLPERLVFPGRGKMCLIDHGVVELRICSPWVPARPVASCKRGRR